MRLPDPPLLLITGLDPSGQPPEDLVRAALAGGCRWISFRERSLSCHDYEQVIRILTPLVTPWGACLSVHLDTPEGLSVPISGVHLSRCGNPVTARQRLGAGVRIGLSAHNAATAWAAAEAGTHYVTLSPIFAPLSKPSQLPPLGLEELEKISRQLTIPVVALGGITRSRVRPCLTAGAQGVAVMGAVVGSEDPAQVVAELIRELRR